MRTLALLLLLAAACTEPLDTDEAPLALGDVQLVACGGTIHHLTDNDAGGPEETIIARDIHVGVGQTIFVDASLTGRQVNDSGDDDILQGLHFKCNGPVQDWVTTTQNDLRGGPWLTTHAHVVLDTPGDYTCTESAWTVHDGAKLDVDGTRSCIATTDEPAADWPTNAAVWVSDGQAVAINHTAYVMQHTFTVPSYTTSVDFHGDIELTDINSDASGTTIATCTRWGHNMDPALGQVYLEAAQLSTNGGTCGGYVLGAKTQIDLSARTHHQKFHVNLSRPFSTASNCLPQFTLRAVVHTDAGGNELCFHGGRYSNIFAFTHGEPTGPVTCDPSRGC